MIVRVVLLFCTAIAFVFSLQHEKKAHLTLWPEKCTKGSIILNDCNWCWCDNQKFACKARVCNEVDMFGHFNDAIQDINVGMEGHGSWRTSATICEPLVQYERDGLICICTEEGIWPNPVCRDVFRVLHPVDTSKKSDKVDAQKCTASSLYLISCNVCFCPQTGRIDPSLCTKRNCTADDPVIQDLKEIKPTDDKQGLEIYAECQLDRKYKVGCRNCMCLRNNRLLCNKCDASNSSKDALKRAMTSYCDNVAPGQVFDIECNLCVCDSKGLLYCTTRLCIGKSKSADPAVLRTKGLQSVERPFDDLDCDPGTTWMKDCNKCICVKLSGGQKFYSCQLKECAPSKNPFAYVTSDCVEGTMYEMNCQICRCNRVQGAKIESCHLNPKCTGVKAVNEPRSLDIKSLHGYCEPGHTYQKDCNTCRCLPDGKVLMCTPSICDKESKQPVMVDIVPVSQKQGSTCTKDQIYTIDCNYCFCLSNGNMLCSTADCSKKKKN